jgi:hypothetical protein
MSLEYLRKLAKNNLCEQCFKKYKQIIEPSLEEWRFNPLYSWNHSEMLIQITVMKLEGVYKSESIFWELNDEEEKSGEVDVRAFRKIQKWSMKKKLDCLKKHGVLREKAYELLNIARKRRNKIHGVFSGISEDDYKLFNAIVPVVNSLYIGTLYPPPIENVDLISESERIADKLLSNLKSNAD